MFKGWLPSVLALCLFSVFAAYHLVANLKPMPYESAQLAWDLQWLNAIAIIFLAVLSLIWTQPTSRKFKSWLSIIGLSVWGIASVSLLFNGTPFGWNAYWGDQLFRTVMILKFMTFGWFTDFYYKDLPAYYPPLYFYLLGKYARLFSLEAYQMLKEGSYLIFVFGPALLYLMWRKLVTGFQAICIVFASFLTHSVLILATPHEFLANIFFVPWWLYFVERMSSPNLRRRFWILGGVIGALIFMCFYYSFFVGAVVIAIRIVSLAFSAGDRKTKWISLKRSCAMILSAAVFSAVYWLPLLGSMVFIGSTPGQNRWFHIGYANIKLPFIEVSVVGLLSLAGLVYALRRFYVPINRGLLLLVAAVPMYYVVGYILGNLDMPLLYIKAAEFLKYVGAVLIGLAAAGLTRAALRNRKLKYVSAAGLALLLLFFFGSFTNLIQQQAVDVARKASPPEKFTELSDPEALVGKVFLTNAHTLGVFLPTFYFISPGEHSSHPAGRFHDRVTFLNLLGYIDDAYIMAVALHHNVFDKVDFIWPRIKGNTCEIPVTLSHYPDRLYTHTFTYERSMFSDTSLFRYDGDSKSFMTVEIPRNSTRRWVSPAYDSWTDSMLNVAELYVLKESLNSVGNELLNSYMDVDWSTWKRVEELSGTRRLGEMVELTSSQFAVANDSLFFVFQLKVLRDCDADYCFFFHIYSDGSSKFDNFDFWPQRPTSSWKKGETILCWRVTEKQPGPLLYHLGLFEDDERLGEGCWGTTNQQP